MRGVIICAWFSCFSFFSLPLVNWVNNSSLLIHVNCPVNVWSATLASVLAAICFASRRSTVWQNIDLLQWFILSTQTLSITEREKLEADGNGKLLTILGVPLLKMGCKIMRKDSPWAADRFGIHISIQKAEKSVLEPLLLVSLWAAKRNYENPSPCTPLLEAHPHTC